MISTCGFVVTTIIIGAGQLGLHAGTVCLECRGVAVFNVGEGNWYDCRRRSQWSFLVCDEVGNLELQMTLKGDVFEKEGASGWLWVAETRRLT